MGKYKYKMVSAYGGSCVVPPSSEFYLEYKKGTNVRAPKGSLGIMLFQHRKLAMMFDCRLSKNKRLIKRVIPIGKPTFPDKVVWGISDSRLKTFNKSIAGESKFEGITCQEPPKGTVCYSEVLVVD